MTIGQLAKQSGVGIETIRFYERRSLIPEPLRTASGYRQYDQAAVRRVLFIRRAQELGFTLSEIGGLMSLSVEPSASCIDVEERAEHTISRIDDQLRDLKRMRKALVSLTRDCHAGLPTGECPILEMLGD